MTDEEYLKKRLDFLRRNSIYGVNGISHDEMIKIVNSHFERNQQTKKEDKKDE